MTRVRVLTYVRTLSLYRITIRQISISYLNTYYNVVRR